ncbi:MAG: hypothetical protein M1814_005177 [Vezdaea aestivalis]|nr:MAG: hypothetical protein M1814_005177 [Vezdaea aestivalis]
MAGAEAGAVTDDLRLHLIALEKDPSLPLDSTLFRSFSLNLTEADAVRLLPHFLPLLVPLLARIGQDHDVLVGAILQLLEWTSFTRCLDFTSPADLTQALQSPVPSINMLAISLVRKAASQSSEAAMVAGMPDLVLSLITTWLETEQVDVADLALKSLEALLTVDKQRLLWRRLFEDETVYSTFFSTCKPGQSKLGARATTIAQARLLAFVSFLACDDFEVIASSHFPDMEILYTKEKGKGSLLDFVALSMINDKDDMLITMTLYTFYAELLASGNRSALKYLVTQGIHEFMIQSYLGTHQQILTSSLARYMCTFATCFSEDIENVSQILSRIKLGLEKEDPQPHLEILVSLPFSDLIPSRMAWQSSPLSLLVKLNRPDYLFVLATLFNDSKRSNAAASRILYTVCIAQNPGFWKIIVRIAETVAMKEAALAAIKVVRSVITATWAASDDRTIRSWTQASGLPIPPLSGTMAILQPPAVEHVLPYLMGPAPVFTNLVGGRGDVEGAAHKVGTARFETLRALLEQTKTTRLEGQESDLDDLREALRARVEKGPWARDRGIGGNIATIS